MDERRVHIKVIGQFYLRAALHVTLPPDTGGKYKVRYKVCC